jgi:biotin carboxyl carrier protein
MKKYRITVNGKVYEVELEPVEEGAAVAAPAAPVATKVESKPVAAPAAVSAGERVVKAPIGGGVVKVSVNVGDSVKKGQTLLVIEAMKLENEVVAPVDGSIKAINVAKGANVNTGDSLVVLG